MAVCVFAPPVCVTYADEDGLTIHFIDVGQGDSCIVELPGDKTMLIDAGENKTSVYEKIDGYITENIKNDDGETIAFFDYVIMTHSDSDHIGSMDEILEKYHAKTVYRPNQMCTYRDCVDHAFGGNVDRDRFWGDDVTGKSTLAYHTALEAAYENADEVIVTNPYDATQNHIEVGGCEIDFYSPLSPSYSDNNNYSPIMIIEYMGVNIVLTGDAESKNESEFVKAVNSGVDERYGKLADLSADVIKLGHHGSGTSSSEDFLNIVTKERDRDDAFVVISCGNGNKYGHPHKQVLERLDKLGFKDDRILRTDQKGDIVISVKEIDGQYAAVYGDLKGATDKENTLSRLIGAFNEMNVYAKAVLIAIAIVIAVTVAVMLARSRKNKRGRKR